MMESTPLAYGSMTKTYRSMMESRFDAAIEWVMKLSAQNSGSHNLAGLRETGLMIEELYRDLGVVSHIPMPAFPVLADDGELVDSPVGNIIEIRSPSQKGPEVLLVSHYDTVFGIEHAFQTPRRERDRLIGPGVADAKGGIVVLWMALSAMAELGDETNWRLVVVPDEEIGSPSSAPFLRQAARSADLGFGFEPSLPDGSMAAVRPGSGTFTVRIDGRAAHAGRALADGRNAILAASRFMLAVEQLNEHPELLANPAFIRGGGPTNIVPDFALVRFNIRPTTNEARDWALSQVTEALANIDGVEGLQSQMVGGFNRAPKPMTPSYRELLEEVSSTAQSIGMKLGYSDTGGVCDGNVLFEAGLVNVDNLGPTGGNLHASGEYVELATFVERAHLAAAITSSDLRRTIANS